MKEEEYDSRTQHEHALLSPGMFVGSVKSETENIYILNTENVIEQKVVKYNPGFIKIFDELLVNTIDHSVKFDTVTIINVDIDPIKNTISVCNNGPGIPIKINEKTGLYNPEMIFGHMLTSSSYNTDVKKGKITGSINGLGSKLTNIFSTKFEVETVDSTRKLNYHQVFENNMYKVNDYKITKMSKASFTKITYQPDLKRFELSKITDDLVSVMKKRVYDITACTNKKVKVSLNGELIPIKEFKDYTKLYFNNTRIPDAYEKIEFDEYIWEIAVYRNDSPQQVSFVNGIYTIKGGKHVECVLKQISKKLIERINSSKTKIEGIKPKYIEDHLFLFVRATVNEALFDSQTKETLKTPISKFFLDPNKKIEISDSFIDKLFKSGIIQDIKQLADFKNQKELSKTTGVTTKKSKLFDIPKLDDAKHAGTSKSLLCSLFIVEGDSAKALAVSGMSEIDQDYYGIYPVKGKILNVREATHKQRLENSVIQDIIKVIGLRDPGKKVYTKENIKELRYGKIISLTDADVDGIHIKGLLFNIFSFWWPSLLEIKGFFQDMITPIIKIFPLKKSSKVDPVIFYTEADYNNYAKIHKITGTIKYYKGLGTSTDKEAKEIFKNTNFTGKDTKKINLAKLFSIDPKDTEKWMSLAFSKDCITQRKDWVSNATALITTESTQVNKDVSYSDFIHFILVLFSVYDNIRSIPGCDGLKPSHRKILFTMFKENYTKEIKVAQLGGRVSEVSGYHHGEASLFKTIIGMAQNFVGTNNWNLLSPNGQFGTRLNSNTAAAPRYIYTESSEYSKLLFNKDDLNLVEPQIEENVTIEPKFYMTILPIVLINGSEGIGTGFSTFIPNYNPDDIIENIKRYLNGQELTEMIPWYRGYKGKIEKIKDGSYVSYGVYKKVISTNSIRITEIPVKTWIDDYKEFYEELEKNETYGISKVDSVKDNTIIDFTLTFKTPELYDEFTDQPKEKIIKILKLSKPISTRNMYLFDCNSKLTKYNTTEEILIDFIKLRLIYNQKRKDYIINNLEKQSRVLHNKIKYINEVIKGTLIIFMVKKNDLIVKLTEKKYDMIDNSFNYLGNMPNWTFTYEKVKELQDQYQVLQKELDLIKQKTTKQLLLDDLLTITQTTKKITT